MTGTLVHSAARPASRTRDATVRRIPIKPGCWRVVDVRGLIIGHVEQRVDPRGTRYRARRYRATARAFLELGEFWTADEAVQCLCAGR